MGQMTTQQIQMPAQNVSHQAVVEVKPKTDSFIKVVSDIHWGWLIAGGICLMIGVLVALIVLSKITPLGQMITKAWNGLAAMFKALIAWKPKGK
jgi:hypothetical protein